LGGSGQAGDQYANEPGKETQVGTRGIGGNQTDIHRLGEEDVLNGEGLYGRPTPEEKSGGEVQKGKRKNKQSPANIGSHLRCLIGGIRAESNEPKVSAEAERPGWG